MKPTWTIPLIIALLSIFSLDVSAQTGDSQIGPSKGAIIGALVGVAAVTSIILYATLHKSSITGCTRIEGGTNILTDENDKAKYALISGDLQLSSGERLKLQGKKRKDKSGNRTFQVKKVKHAFGPCPQ